MKCSDINTKTKEGRLLVAAIQMMTHDETEAQAILNDIYDYADLDKEPAEEDNDLTMNGKVLTYSSFTPSDKNNLVVEVLGHENYFGNRIKSGDDIKIIHPIRSIEK